MRPILLGLVLVPLAAAWRQATLAQPVDDARGPNGECFAVCGAKMWWDHKRPEIKQASSHCLPSLNLAIQNEAMGLVEHRKAISTSGEAGRQANEMSNMYFGIRGDALERFRDCVNTAEHEWNMRNHSLRAEEDHVNDGIEDRGPPQDSYPPPRRVEPPRLPALRGHTFIDGVGVSISTAGGRHVGDYVTGAVLPDPGYARRFSSAGGYIVGPNAFRLDWIRRLDGQLIRMPPNYVVPMR